MWPLSLRFAFSLKTSDRGCNLCGRLGKQNSETKNNFSGIEISWQTPLVSLAIPSVSLASTYNLHELNGTDAYNLRVTIQSTDLIRASPCPCRTTVLPPKSLVLSNRQFYLQTICARRSMRDPFSTDSLTKVIVVLPLKSHLSVASTTFTFVPFAVCQCIWVFSFNPLSQEGGRGLLQPPLSDFPSYHFCVFAKIAIRSIYPPFVEIPTYL